MLLPLTCRKSIPLPCVISRNRIESGWAGWRGGTSALGLEAAATGADPTASDLPGGLSDGRERSHARPQATASRTSVSQTRVPVASKGIKLISRPAAIRLASGPADGNTQDPELRSPVSVRNQTRRSHAKLQWRKSEKEPRPGPQAIELSELDEEGRSNCGLSFFAALRLRVTFDRTSPGTHTVSNRKSSSKQTREFTPGCQAANQKTPDRRPQAIEL